MFLYLEIVTPEGIVWKNDKVDSVIIPTRAGEIQILPGHIPLVTVLEAGDLVVSVSGEREDIAVSTGYARCMGESISILTEAAIDVKNIDEQTLEDAKQRAIKALEDAKNNAAVDAEELGRLESVMRFAVVQHLTKAKRK